MDGAAVRREATMKPVAQSSGSGDGVEILPIPPPLEFPYPEEVQRRPVSRSPERAVGTSAVPFRPVSIAQSHIPDTALAETPEPPPGTSPTAPTRPTAGKTRTVTNPPKRLAHTPARPTVNGKRYGTEHPVPRTRGTMMGRMRRTETQASPFYNPHIWGSDNSDSSDEEEAGHNRKLKPSGTEPEPARLQRRVTASGQGENHSHDRFAVGNEDYHTRGHVSKNDGRLNIHLHETANRGYLAKALGASIEHRAGQHIQHGHQQRQELQRQEAADTQQALSPLRKEDGQRPQFKRHGTTASTIDNLDYEDPLPRPKLNIVIQVIGSRGDIQPFLKLGKILKEEHGHRVRIATHPTFKTFVEKDVGLEFFSIGGDPAELMAFMVKNPGLIPKKETFTSGEIQRRRASLFDMYKGFWRACINATDDESDPENLKLLKSKGPFVADAIIANPVSFAHIHCAERLGIPLHLMFTFPNTPTQQFPHPLTNIKQTNVDANYTNFMSYQLVEMMHWQGLGDLLNEFRVKTLGLDPMDTLWAPGQLFRMKVPYSYLWSPGLIPKPADWGPEINITGFVFLDLASSFKPPDNLAKFLDQGTTPVYIGFGSIVVDDPDKFTQLIFEAAKMAGVRALVNKGWGGLGDEDNTPDHIFMLDNTPHDWLFPRVSAVVHHGGAGTTAIGLKCGKPTMVVPFFGDQPFWGAMIAKAGAGAEPVPYKKLSAEKLAEGIKQLLTKECQEGAKLMAEKIETEGDGAVNAVKSFHKSLPLVGERRMRCSILQERAAVWHLKGTDIQLSALAAEVLVSRKKVTWQNLRLCRVFEWNDFEGPGEPLTGAGVSVAHDMFDVAAGVGTMPYKMGKIIKSKTVRDKARKEEVAKHDIDHSESKHQVHEHHHHHHPHLHLRHHNKASNATREQKEQSGQVGMEQFLPRGNMLDSSNKTALGGPHPDLDGERPAMPNKLSSQHDEHTADSETAVGEDDNQAEDHLDGTPSESEKGSNVDNHIERESNVDNHIERELAEEAGRGIARSGVAMAQIPLNLSLALARGFHNAPRLYGDDTVRPVRRVNGVKSGFRAAGEEFAYSIYDGCIGVVRHPYTAARDEGVSGFVKGMGKGVGGFVLKPLAAIIGLPAYSVKGLTKELTKRKQPTTFIRKARVLQGSEERSALSPDEYRQKETTVMEGWKTIQEVDRLLKEKRESMGLKGRVENWKDRKWMKENGVMNNVGSWRRAIDARREGRDWEVEFREERERTRRIMEQRARERKAARKGRQKERQEAVDGKLQALGSEQTSEQEKSKQREDSKERSGGVLRKLRTRRLRKRATNMADERVGTATLDAAGPNPPQPHDAHVNIPDGSS